ncbi:MAG TPA: prepilin-type N-terminal cleavage/methylation domain-containing protein [Thermoanaerobaculia bacterium]|nr:prepilin-type N-terminal cleavage/methylation domain-containing protein [Thermoanaerobaculia bacterium]
MTPPHLRPRGQEGFSLAELLVALALMSLVLSLASALLMESSRQLVESAGEQRDAPVSLILARIRGDVVQASSFAVAVDKTSTRLLLFGHPEGTVQYENVGEELRRAVLVSGKRLEKEVILWRGLEAWSGSRIPPLDPDEPGTDVLRLDFVYRRRSTAKTPLPVLPAYRGATEEARLETMFLVPRGNGLGTNTW